MFDFRPRSTLVWFLLASWPLFGAGQPDLPPQATLSFPPTWHLRQGRNQCGPAAVWACIRLLTPDRPTLAQIDAETGWRLVNQMTLPWGLTDTLTRHGLHPDLVLKGHLSEVEQVSFLKSTLAAGRPIILLNKTPAGVLHWFTVIGFSNRVFYLYDSLVAVGSSPGLTRDENGPAPGNRSLRQSDLLAAWRAGDWGGWHNVAIIP